MMDEIVRVLDLNAPIERVWAFLTEKDKVAQWLMQSDIEAAEGRQFRFTGPAEGRWDGVIACEVTELIPLERISYTWAANDIGVTTLVTFDVESTSNGTRLRLNHRDFEGSLPGTVGRHAAGWASCFKRLLKVFTSEPPLYDWSEFQVTYFIDAPVEVVSDAWMTADGLKRFWALEVSCIDGLGKAKSLQHRFDNGDRVRVRFTTGGETELEILTIEPNRVMSFSFGEDYGWVEVRLQQKGNRTEVVLRQFGLPEDETDQWSVHAHARGWWIANLMNLQSVLRYQNDLRVLTSGYEGGLGTDFRNDPEQHDWKSFDIYLHVNATPPALLNYWRQSDGLIQFFIRQSEFLDESGNIAEEGSAGTEYRWQFIHDFNLSGRFLEVSEDTVSFTFGSTGVVTVAAEETSEGSLLHLRQGGMADTESDRIHSSLNCRSCWIYFMMALKSLVEHGVDLRDKDPETADAISVGYNLSR